MYWQYINLLQVDGTTVPIPGSHWAVRGPPTGLVSLWSSCGQHANMMGNHVDEDVATRVVHVPGLAGLILGSISCLHTAV